MQKIMDFLRIKEWFTSKCSLMIGIFLYCYMKNTHKITGEFWLQLIAFVVFISSFLAFGYVINDFCDREIDIMAGKKKIIATFPKWICIAILVIMVVIAAAPVLIVGHGKLKLVIAVFITILAGMTYSAPPARFKEKGVWGLIVSSVAQRCLPLWVLYELLVISLSDLALWEILSFFIGLRYILVHQRIDAQNDLKTGTVTFATRHIGMVGVGIYLSFFVEVTCLLLLFRPWNHVAAFCGMIVLILYVLWQMGIVRKKFGENIFMTFSCVPLEDFYNFIVPVIYMFKLAGYTKAGIILIVVFIIVMWKFQWEKWKLMFGGLR